MPLVEPQVHHPPPALVAAKLGVAPRDVRIREHDVRLAAATHHHVAAAQDVAAALAHEQRLAPVERRIGELANLAVGRVDHRVPEVPGGGRRRGRRVRRLLLVWHGQELGLDPELAEVEPLVRVELHLGPSRERERLLAGVLEQIVGQLLPQCRLIARELLPVLLGQEHAVVVWHVHARDGGHLVVLHLLGQLVGQLHGLNARLEGAAERALHEPAELRLQVAQHAHLAPQSSPKPL